MDTTCEQEMLCAIVSAALHQSPFASYILPCLPVGVQVNSLGTSLHALLLRAKRLSSRRNFQAS